MQVEDLITFVKDFIMFVHAYASLSSGMQPFHKYRVGSVIVYALVAQLLTCVWYCGTDRQCCAVDESQSFRG